ncbi:MAG TPA: hypothetical protein VI670_06270 [Thermoanaerobaculia bacterium]|jgi:hypothetical protein
MLRKLVSASVFLLAATAAAQQRSIFDVDDFVDPRQHDTAVFASRLVLGAANNYVDDTRPLHRDARFLHIANSVYWSAFQFDYKHSEVRADAPPPIRVCNCSPPIYFPPVPASDEVPLPPRPGGKDTVQIGWYGGKDLKLRYRLSASNQNIATDLFYPNTNGPAGTLHGHERALGVEGDTYIPYIGFGTVNVARTVRSGTADDRTQSELAYTSRLPGLSVGKILVRGLITVGGVSGRGARGVNVVSPIFEAFWHDQTTRANIHLAWNPMSTRSGRNGWETQHQIALFIDRGIVLFRKH